MIFKNIKLFAYSHSHQLDTKKLSDALSKNPFHPCGETQQQSYGWVAPRETEGSPIIEPINGGWLLKMMIEDKTVPAGVLKRHIKERCDLIERETGRKSGRKYQAELKEDILLDLLPVAFPNQRVINVWISPKNNWVFMDATTTANAGLVTSSLAKLLSDFSIRDLQTKTSPSAAMMDWMLDEAPTPWTVDMDCELQIFGDVKSAVRFSSLSLDTPEVRNYLEQGMQPTQLAVTWRDRVSILLTDNLELKRVRYLDNVVESADVDSDDLFMSDALLETGELLPLVESLISVLSGQAGVY